MRTLAALAAGAVLAFSVPSVQAGDATRGEAVFQRCATCHSLSVGQNGLGPSLAGVIGRKAGTVPGYSYSKAMIASGIVWDAASLKKFLADPEAALPGTKMHSGAVDNPQAADDLLTYLQRAN